MELSFLREFEDKPVRLVCKNNFSYSKVRYKITSKGLLEFLDRNGDTIHIEPEFVSMVSELKEDWAE